MTKKASGPEGAPDEPPHLTRAAAARYKQSPEQQAAADAEVERKKRIAREAYAKPGGNGKPVAASTAAASEPAAVPDPTTVQKNENGNKVAAVAEDPVTVHKTDSAKVAAASAANTTEALDNGLNHRRRGPWRWIGGALVVALLFLALWYFWPNLKAVVPARSTPVIGVVKQSEKAAVPPDVVVQTTSTKETTVTTTGTTDRKEHPGFPPGETPSGVAVVAAAPAKAPAQASAASKSAAPAAKVKKEAKAKDTKKPVKVATQSQQASALASKPATVLESKTTASAVLPVQTPSTQKAAEGKLFRWTKVGGDPCNPKAGCTLEWALQRTGWPSDVQLGLIAAVKGSSPTTTSITSGLGGSKGPTWTGWMTWGKYSPKFEANIVAAWPSGQYEPASLWTYEWGSTKYSLIKVRKCGNWGGWTEVLHQKPAPVYGPTRAPVPPTSPDVMPLGVIPVVSCLDEE